MQPELIGGRYRVQAAIGQGGMGTVWLCRDETLTRDVAVKQVGLLPGESVTDSARAMREARSSAALSHRNVVTVFDVVEEGGAIWMVMEHVPSRSLSDIIREDGPLPPERVASIGAQVADGLASAHAAGITHRDVKPGNVLVRDDGVAKISDFGIARSAGDPALTQTGMFIGTPMYFSPELARGAEPDPSADVWALGATLYAAVEGSPPFEQTGNAIAVIGEIANEDPPPPKRAGFLAPVLSRMLDRDPSSRWSMADAAHALHRADARHGDRTRATTTTAFAGRTQERPAGRTAPVAGAGAGAAAGAAAGTADTMTTERTEQPPTRDTTGTASRSPGPRPTPAPRQGRERRRTPLYAALALAALALVVGLAYLVANQDDDGPPAASGEPSTSSEASAEEAEQPAERAGRGSEAAQVAFLEDYFQTVPEDTDTGWTMLGPGMKADGRDSYEGWWSSVRDVRASQISPNAGEDTVDLTLRYTMNDGQVQTERQRIVLVRSGDGGYLINDDYPIG